MIAVVHGPYSLDSVLRKCRGVDAEIILVVRDADLHFEPAPIVRIVRVHAGSSEREMRLAGTKEARGELVAVLGDRYDLGEGWMRAALSGEATAISGPVLPRSQSSLAEWAIYLAEYPSKAAPVEGNMVRRKGASGETRVLFVPELRVVFARLPGWKQYLVERYADSREWAREQVKGSSALQRFAAAAARIALPMLLLRRRATFKYGWRFVAALPYLFVSGLVEATGEISGFLSGAK